MGSVSNPKDEKLKKIQKLKRHLVATLVLPQREFGVVIRAIREELGITPVTRLPSPDFVSRLGNVDLGSYPRGIPRQGFLAKKYPKIAEFSASDPQHLEMLYRELSRIYHRYIPTGYRDEQIIGWSWSRFLVACVFYDPPETQLDQFAAYDDPPSDPAPVRWLPEAPDELLYAEKQRWIKTIEEIRHHYLNLSLPEGSNLITDAWDRNPRIEKEYRAACERVPRIPFIEVSENATEADVIRAFRMIVDARKEQHKERSKGGRSRRDPLTCIQAAILYDDYNPRKPEDKRRRTRTFEQLAGEVGLHSGSAAKKHVLEGRKFRHGEPLPEV